MPQQTSYWLITICIILTLTFGGALILTYREKHKTWTREELEEQFRRHNGIKRH